MNDLASLKDTKRRTKRPHGVDPLIREAADDAAAALCRAAFNAILNGELAVVSELADSTGASPRDVERLVGRALIVEESGRVRAAHGLSEIPVRQHRLTLRGRRFWTWCAIDAAGIPAGLGEDAVAETTCQLCGTAVRVEFKAGKVVDASHPRARACRVGRSPHKPRLRARNAGRVLQMTDTASRHMGRLFDAELCYQDGMAPVLESDDRGPLVGSGTLRWSNFEPVFADHCRLTVAGTIETDDGAEIRVDSQGFALQPTRGGPWKVASAVRFCGRRFALPLARGGPGDRAYVPAEPRDDESQEAAMDAGARRTRFRMRVDGMTCPSCEHHVEKALGEAGAHDVEADFRRGEAHIEASASIDPTRFVGILMAIACASARRVNDRGPHRDSLQI
jgi:copper chaperone CopZ